MKIRDLIAGLEALADPDREVFALAPGEDEPFALEGGWPAGDRAGREILILAGRSGACIDGGF